MSTALPAPEIPSHRDELTPAWLTAALRARGHLKDSSVTSVSQEILGEGAGFVGEIVRLRLELDRPEHGAPRSVIAKFPIGNAKNRQLGEALGAYDREIRFYEQLASRVSLSIPACYFTAMDPNPFEGREEEFLAFLERLPRWLMRLLIPVGMWFAGRSPRKYILLLEDMAPARVGDQVNGCSLVEATSALRQIARHHAEWWEHPDLDELTWVTRIDVLADYAHILYRRSRKGFLESWAPTLPAHAGQLVDWLDANGVALVRALGRRPRTLLHGDFRLDNLFFRDSEASGDEVPITLFDWQTMIRGPVAFEVGYFISGNLTLEDGARHEDELLRSYHEALAGHGVGGYSLEELRRDNLLAKLWIAYRIILGFHMLDFSNERGTALIRSWVERVMALLPDDLGALEGLLDDGAIEAG